MNKTKLMVLISVIAAAALMVTVAVGSSLWGSELHELENAISQLEEENKVTQEKIVQGTSLTALYEIREELGFAKPSRVIYMGDHTSVAQAHNGASN